MEQALCFPFDLVYLLVVKAGLTHVHSVVIFALHLLCEVELGNMLCTAMWRGEVIEILETMLVSFVKSKFGSFLLQVEIYEAS